MRKDIEITIDTKTSRVNSNSAVAGVKSENLQGNIIIKPIPFIDGVGRFYISGRGSILMEKKNSCYVIPIRSSILSEGDFDFCFKIVEQEKEEGTPIFSSEISDMRVLDTIESEETIPDQYPTWIETFDAKIAEINNLEQNVENAEQERERKTTEAIDNIRDMTAECQEIEDNCTDLRNETEDIKNTARDFVYAVTFAKAETDPVDGCLYFIGEESLGTMGFEINYETGQLEY